MASFKVTQHIYTMPYDLVTHHHTVIIVMRAGSILHFTAGLMLLLEDEAIWLHSMNSCVVTNYT